MKSKFWTSDKIVSIVAIAISLFTLFIFVKQTNIIEEQSKLSVLPYLMLDSSDNGAKKTFSIDLENYGVGPAIIESRVIHYKNKTYDMEFHEFLRDYVPEMDSIHIINFTTLHLGVAIPASSRRNVLIVGGDEYSYKAFLKILERLRSEGFDFEIQYKSIYDDRWKISSEALRPSEIE